MCLTGKDHFIGFGKHSGMVNTKYKQAVPHSVCAERSVRIDQLCKIFVGVYKILRLVSLILSLYIDQIKYIPLVTRAISLIPMSMLYLIISTRNPAAPYAVSNISVTYFFCKITHITIYVSN